MSLSLIEQYYVSDVNGDDADVTTEEIDGIGKEDVFENGQTDDNAEEDELGLCTDIEVKVELLELGGEIVISGGSDDGLETFAAGERRTSQKKTGRRSSEGDGVGDNKTEISQKVDVDLNQTWPFTNCRIVLQLDDDDYGGGEGFGGNLREGWAKEGTKHVFYDKVTLKEANEIGEQLRQVKHCSLPQRKCNSPRQRSRHNRETLIRSAGQGQKSALGSDLHFLDYQNGTRMVFEAVFKCPYCLEIFPEGEGLILHLSTQHNLYERKTDNENIEKISTIYDNHTKEPLIIQVPSEKGTKFHIDDQKPFPCDKCTAAYSTKHGLQRHVQSSHLKIKRHTCTQCGKQFAEQYSLNRHILTHTTSRPRPFKCTLCAKSFVNGASLNRHNQTHTGEKRHTCTQCGKQFYDRTALNRHILTHSGNRPRPFKCSLCAKSFIDRRSLSRHHRTHIGGEKRHTCTQCDKQFYDQTALNRHVLTHAASRTRPSSTQGVLSRHNRTHTDKPHSCPKCSRQFLSASNLKRHILSHTGRRNYECLECGLRFKYSQGLRRHQVTQKHLPEEEEF